MSPSRVPLAVPTVCTSPTDTDAEDAGFMSLQAVYEEEMMNLTSKRRYTSASVLILYWDKMDDPWADLQNEIRDLKSVFENDYHFKVKAESLNPILENGKSSAQKLLNLYLSAFVFEEDKENSLLIIYYAGHGVPDDKNGGIILKGDCSIGKHVGQVAWNKSETLITEVEYADVFLIFDCCFAGRLGGTIDSRFVDNKLFEFLGATAANELARLPGKESFTSALIHALKKLANEQDGFTTSKLLDEILKAPNFPRGRQTPTLSERKYHNIKRLVLGPLDSESAATESPTAQLSSQDQNDFSVSLGLQLFFETRPTCEEMKALCNGVKELIRAGELKAKQVMWRGMHRRGGSSFEYAPAVHRAANRFMQPVLGKRKRTGSVVSAGETPTSPLQPRSRPTLEVPQSPAVSAYLAERDSTFSERIASGEDSEDFLERKRRMLNEQ